MGDLRVCPVHIVNVLYEMFIYQVNNVLHINKGLMRTARPLAVIMCDSVSNVYYAQSSCFWCRDYIVWELTQS